MSKVQGASALKTVLTDEIEGTKIIRLLTIGLSQYSEFVPSSKSISESLAEISTIKKRLANVNHILGKVQKRLEKAHAHVIPPP